MQNMKRTVDIMMSGCYMIGCSVIGTLRKVSNQKSSLKKIVLSLLSVLHELKILSFRRH